MHALRAAFPFEAMGLTEEAQFVSVQHVMAIPESQIRSLGPGFEFRGIVLTFHSKHFRFLLVCLCYQCCNKHSCMFYHPRVFFKDL